MKLTKIQIAETVARYNSWPVEPVVECLAEGNYYIATGIAYCWLPERNQKLNQEKLSELVRPHNLIIAFSADMANIAILAMIGAVEIARIAQYGLEGSTSIQVVADIGSEPFTKSRKLRLVQYCSITELASNIYNQVKFEKQSRVLTLISNSSKLSGSRLVNNICNPGIQAALKKAATVGD